LLTKITDRENSQYREGDKIRVIVETEDHNWRSRDGLLLHSVCTSLRMYRLLHWFCWGLLGSDWFFWVLLRYAGVCWVLLGSARFCLVLLGSAGFYWVLIGSDWFCLVLLGYARF